MGAAMAGGGVGGDPLRGLTPAQRRAWSLIIRMARVRGKPCFTYNTLLRFWRENPDIRINANTLERRVRELVELGILVRREIRERRGGRERPRYYYCISDEIARRFL